MRNQTEHQVRNQKNDPGNSLTSLPHRMLATAVPIKLFVLLSAILLASPVHAANNILAAVIDLSTLKIVGYITDAGTQHTGTLLAGDTIGSHDYYGGSFDKVEFYDSVNYVFQGQLDPCDNIFMIDTSLGQAAVLGYSGGNGTSGTVKALTHPSGIAGLYIGGSFSSAGGNPYSVNIACYRESGGWNNNTIFAIIGGGVDTFTWTGMGSGRRIMVQGTFTFAETNHPYPYDAYDSSVSANNTVYLNGTWSFDNTYFTVN